MLNGIALGATTFATLLVTFIKLPFAVRKFLLKHKLFTDISAGVIVYLVLGAISKSITAVVGAIVSGLLVGIALELVTVKEKKESEQQAYN